LRIEIRMVVVHHVQYQSTAIRKTLQFEVCNLPLCLRCSESYLTAAAAFGLTHRSAVIGIMSGLSFISSIVLIVSFALDIKKHAFPENIPLWIRYVLCCHWC
jgi:hypothetical protein